MSIDRHDELWETLSKRGQRWVDGYDCESGVGLDGRWDKEEIPLLIEWLQLVIATKPTPPSEGQET